MIELRNSNSVLANNIFTYGIGKEELSHEQLEELSAIKIASFKLDNSVYQAEEKIFFKEFSRELIKNHQALFVFMEKLPKPISKSRSYKKLMYPHRKQVGEGNLFEEEVIVKENQSILVSAVAIDDQNLDYVCDHLIGSLFVFGYVFGKDQEVKAAFDQLSLSSIIKSENYVKGIFDLNILWLIAHVLNDQAAVFMRSTDGKDNSYMNVFYTNPKVTGFVEEMRRKFKVVSRGAIN